MIRRDFSKVPEGAKLVRLGSMYREPPGSEWRIVAFFEKTDGTHARQQFTHKLLLHLRLGRIFHPRNGADNNVGGREINLPPMDQWKKRRHRDLPRPLRILEDHPEWGDDVGRQAIHEFQANGETYWLSPMVVARTLLLPDGHFCRAAFAQANMLDMAACKVESDGVVNVRLHGDLPLSHLEKPIMEAYVRLLFNRDIKESFQSIFRCMNKETVLDENRTYERFAFDFQLPNLGGIGMKWHGKSAQIGNRKHHYIMHISEYSGFPPMEYASFRFHHVNAGAIVLNTAKDTKIEGVNAKSAKSMPEQMDRENPPGKQARRTIREERSTSVLHTDDLNVGAVRPKKFFRPAPSGNDPARPPGEEKLSPLKSSRDGKNQGVDPINQTEPELAGAEEKFPAVLHMLSFLERRHGWSHEKRFGTVRRMNCRKAHLIDERPRYYMLAGLSLGDGGKAWVLEVELTGKESLSTLVFTAEDSKRAARKILEALMLSDASKGHKSMKWKTELNRGLTIDCNHHEHPRRNLKTTPGAWDAWAERGAARIRALRGRT